MYVNINRKQRIYNKANRPMTTLDCWKVLCYFGIPIGTPLHLFLHIASNMGINKERWNESSRDEPLELCETFYINNKKNTVFQVSLSDKGFCLKKNTGVSVKEQIIMLNDIVGCRFMCSKKKSKRNIRSCACSSPNVNGESNMHIESSSNDCSAFLYIYAYILKKRLRNVKRRERTVLTLRFRSFDKYEDNVREAQKWQTVIKKLKNIDCLNSIFQNQRTTLVILNPKSGAGKARELFHQEVVPVFLEAEVSYDLYVTKYANYAKELVRAKDLSNWRGIVVVGGDGIYWEVINGLMQREDWENVFQYIAVGIVPCGSGNGLAKSISHSKNEPYDPKPILSAALTVVRGKTSLMDLVRVETRSQIMFSFLSVGWGLISDIDIESERIRSLGYQRFTVWSVHRLISLRTYHGKLSYLPRFHENNEIGIGSISSSTDGASKLRKDICPMNTEEFVHSENTEPNEFGEAISLETLGDQEDFRQRVDSWYSAASRKSAYYSMTESLYQSTGGTDGQDTDVSTEKDNCRENISQTFGPSPKIPSLMTPVPNTWTIEEGEYVMVHAAYQSHLGTDCLFAPSAKLNDGIIWLVIIRGGVSRSQLLTFLLNMSSGTHIPTKNNEFIKILPVSAFRIEPSGSEGIITVDGERVEYGSIQGEMFGGLVNVMVP